MSAYKPLVVDGGQVEQLQPGTDLDIPLNEVVACLQRNQLLLITWMVEQGFELPEELIEQLNKQTLWT